MVELIILLVILNMLAGLLMDLTQDSRVPFLVFGALEVVGGFFAFGSYVTHKRAQSPPCKDISEIDITVNLKAEGV